MAKFPGTDSKHYKSMLLIGHCDVVAADDLQEWEYPPFDAQIVDGVLHGRGVVDMLGGLAGMVMAIKAMAETKNLPKGCLLYTSRCV